jgi:hypothetical protein
MRVRSTFVSMARTYAGADSGDADVMTASTE